jgi:hypothetical protein
MEGCTLEDEESSMRFLDTGDNLPLGKEVLRSCCRDLETNRACRILSAVPDDTRRACALLGQTLTGLSFYAVGRAVGAYRDVFLSTQDMLVLRAAKEDRPLCVFCGGFWFVYDPERIIIDNVGSNMRLGTRMLNYSVNLGKLWNEKARLEDVWQIVKAETANRKRTTLLGYIDAHEKAQR